jgi:putative NADPH-quinone reductase
VNALVIYSHPVEGSFCSAMRDAAMTGLKQAWHSVSLIDLALDNFDPVMSKSEWDVYISGSGDVPEGLERYVELVKKSEIFVFVYPTWWSGLPAQLKGWLERVMMPGVAFQLNDKNKMRPTLTHVRRVYVLSTFGSPKPYVRFINNNGRRILVRAFRMSGSWRMRTTTLGMHQLDACSNAERLAFLQKIEKVMGQS